MNKETAAGILKRIFQFSDVGIAIVIVGMVLMLIIPLPPGLLDLFLVLNICTSLITILISIYIANPLEFAVFPTALLVATLFRLSLDISATRLILLHGHEGATGVGHVIYGFGEFVVGGQIIVGFIMFIILIVVQLVVITNGAERIAQVAARFTLDAMPGKQMAIDADLHSGLIDAEGAKRRRREIEKESDFYGSMDGAGKFIKGDAIAAIVIMIVNIVGGLLMGILIHGMGAGEALNHYAILTIGNGLAVTIPAFLMSTSMGMVVSRAASDANLGTDVISQVVAQPKALKLAAAFMGFLGTLGLFFKALPAIPFFIMSASVFAVGILLDRQKQMVQVEEQVAEDSAKKEVTKRPESVVTLMQVDILSLEVGRSLLSLLDPNQGAKLLERVNAIRKVIAMELGIVVPGIRFKDNLQLKPNAYVIKIKETEVASGEVMANKFLALGLEEKLKNLKGTRTVDPTYNVPGVWIGSDQLREAERLGCMIFDPVSVIASQLSEVIRTNAADLLGRQDVQALVDNVKRTHPAVVKELVPDQLGLGEVVKILQNLVKERVSIRDLVSILETLADNVTMTRDVEILTECVRAALSRTICKEYVNNEGVINCLTLDHQIEEMIGHSIQRTERGSFLQLDPQTGQEILAAIGGEIEKLNEQNLQPIVLCSPTVRIALKKLTERNFANLVILSWNEIAPKVNVNSVGLISL